MKLRLEDCDSNPASSCGEEDEENVSTRLIFIFKFCTRVFHHRLQDLSFKACGAGQSAINKKQGVSVTAMSVVPIKALKGVPIRSYTEG